MKHQLFLAAVVSLACTACSSEDRSSVISESRQVNNFDSIAAGGAMDIDVKIGTPQRLTLECNQESISNVKTEVKGDELKISLENNAQPKHLSVHIVVPDLKSLNLAGATDATISGLKSDSFSVTSAGAAKVKATGQAENLKIKISGVANVQAGELKSSNCSVAISGAGDADVNASQSLDATISGAGSVKVHGNPAKVSQHIAGVGTVERM